MKISMPSIIKMTRTIIMGRMIRRKTLGFCAGAPWPVGVGDALDGHVRFMNQNFQVERGVDLLSSLRSSLRV
jgi:hypothetical protein